jgi:hypothetical protein
MSAQIGSPMKMVNFEYKTEMIIEHLMYGLLLLSNSLHKSEKNIEQPKGSYHDLNLNCTLIV